MKLHFTNVYAIGMHKDNQQCMDLIKLTSNSLSSDVVALMLMAVQKDNLEVSMNYAIEQWVLITYSNKIRMTEHTVHLM